MALSAAIHLAAIVAIDHFFLAEPVPGASERLLLVIIESRNPVAAAAAVSPTIQRSGKKTANTLKTVPEVASRPIAFHDMSASRQISVMAGKTVAAEAATAIAPTIQKNTPPANSTVSISTTAEAPPAVDVLTAAAPDAGRSVPEKAAFSPRQKKMLIHKIKRWSERPDKMPDWGKSLVWNHDGQEYSASFSALPADDEMSAARIAIEISTIEKGQRYSSEVQLKRLAFSSFAQFVNRWDPDVQIHDDELHGRFHANSLINLRHDAKTKPVFHGKVTTSASRIEFGRTSGPRRRSQIFLGGLETGVRAIPLPRHFAPFPDPALIDGRKVNHLSETTHIRFQADGSYALRPVGSADFATTGRLTGESTYFIAEDNAEVHVSGVVNGMALVYSPIRIVIEGDLVYARDPEHTTEADDFLGLVSDKYVEVAAPEITGPGDLEINGAIYAKRRFSVRGLRSGNGGVLYLYGSLTAGSVSATEPRYATKIRFDHRFDDMRPPGFPMADRYEIESWDADWRVDHID